MLVLSRLIGQSVLIADGLVEVTVNDIRGNKVRLGITAPKEMTIDRKEVAMQKADAALVEVRKAQGKPA